MVATNATYNINLVATTQGNVTALTGQVQAATRAVQQFDQAMARNQQGAGGWMSGLKDGAKNLAAFFGVVGAARFIFDATTRVQQFDVAVQSFSRSTAVAGQAYKDVQEIAARGFSIDPLLRAEQTFLSLGLNLEQAKAYTETIAKMASGTNAANLERIGLAFSQMAAKGKISLEEVRQLGEAGVPALKIFADAAGVSTSEFQKLASQGKVFSDQVLPKVVEEIDKLYGKAYEQRPDTLLGGIGKAQVDLQNLAATWGEQLTPAILLGLDALTGFLTVAQAIPPQQALLAAGAVYLAGRWGAMSGAMGKATQAARDYFTIWRSGGVGALTVMGDMIGKLGKMKAGLIAVAAVAAGAVTAGLFKAEAAANIDRTTAALTNLAETGDLASLSTVKYADRIGEFAKTVSSPGIVKRMEDFAGAIGGIVGIGPGRSKDTAEFLSNLEQIDGTLANMAKSGNAQNAATAYDTLKKAMLDQGISMEEIIRFFPQYNGVLEGIAAGTIKAAGATEQLADKTEVLKDAYSRLAEAATSPGRTFLETARILADYAKAVADAKDKTDKSTKVIADERDALVDLAAAALDVVENQIQAGKSVAQVAKTMKDKRSDLIETAKAMGFSAEEAKRFADNTGLIPSEVRTLFKISGLADLQAAEASIKGIYNTAGIGYSGGAAYNLYIQQQLKVVAGQTIPVMVTNWPAGGGAAGRSTTGSGAGTGTGRIGGVAVARSTPVRMVSI